jgi:hypothetical protein
MMKNFETVWFERKSEIIQFLIFFEAQLLKDMNSLAYNQNMKNHEIA